MSTHIADTHRGRRSWATPLLAACAPGVADIREGRRRGWIPFALLVLAVTSAITVSGRGRLIFADRGDLVVVLISAGALTAAMLLSALQRVRGSGQRVVTTVIGAVLAALMALVPVSGAAWMLLPQIDLLNASFVDAPTTVLPSTGALIDVPAEVPLLGSQGWEWAGRTPRGTGERFNVLLLGGDAGPGRWSLRTDSINLVSIDPATGDTAMIGIPRNLTRAPMPGALAEKFPNGFDNIINAVYTWGAAHPADVEAVLGRTEEPGASLISAVVGELTGVAVDAFVLVDMQGFIEMVDALGGVEVYLEKNIPAPGNVPGGKHPVADMTKGWHRFDGTGALSYSRSRSSDSDYWRMGRQRCLLANLAAQNTTPELVANWPSISQALRSHVTTNLDPRSIEQLIGLARGIDSRARTVSLTPPLVKPSRWSLEEIRGIVHETIYQDSTPPLETSGGVTTATDQVDAAGESSAETSPVASSLTEECRVKN